MTPAFESCFIPTNGIRLHALTAGQGPLVVLVHGWPELSHSWRHQIGPLAEAGYQVVAIDVRGYGRSDRPEPVEAYAMAPLMGDLVGVFDHFQAEQAVLIGHDWGAPIVWNTALAYPERVRAVAGLSVPYFKRASVPPLSLWSSLYTAKDRFFYQVYFQAEGVAEAAFEADPTAALEKVYYSLSGDAVRAGDTWPALPADAALLEHLPRPTTFPAWLSAEDRALYARAFTASGFRGAFNRYRNIDRDYHALPDYGVGRIGQPSAFIGGALDAVRSFVPGMDTYQGVGLLLDDLRLREVIDGVGHWVQQEAPDRVNAALLAFLRGL